MRAPEATTGAAAAATPRGWTAHPGLLARMLGEAAFALVTHRLRSLLTLLGMVIGVASVVLMVAIGEGSRRKVADSMASLGTDTLVVFAGSPRSGGIRGSAGQLPTLTLGDAQAIGTLLSVRAVSPMHSVTAQVVHGSANTFTTITGGSEQYLDTAGWSLRSGSAFSADEARRAANVALLGQTAARALFGQADPVGQLIRIQQQPFTVIGTLSPKGQSMMGQDQDDVVVVPVLAAQRKLRGTVFAGSVSNILVRARSPAEVELAEQEITRLLRQRHRIDAGEEDDFSVRNLGAVADMAASTSRILSLLLGSVALIALVVGGIGIMNIMLVSVTERTREIGLRMALGASQRAIRLQFLLEAVLLSVCGGLLGLLAGLGIGLAVQRVAGLSVVFSVNTLLLSFGVAAAVGIAFGLWPAGRAARLSPVEALRDG